MPRSLLFRLLAVSLTVAVCAIGATAWLTYRTTSDELQGQVARLLETDASIYEELLAYAGRHPSWEEVGPVVAQLSARTGRRIALTTPDGTLLADSARNGEGRNTALPPAPAALIDAVSGPAREDLPPEQPAPVPAGEPVPGGPDPAVNREFVDALNACLTAAGIPNQIHDVGGGFRFVEVLDDRDLGGYNACDEQARRQARERTSADPALLYLGTAGGRIDPVSAAGTGKTFATIVAVASVTIGITVAAGLRLLRPVRALTRAARRMEQGDTSARVKVKGTDEIAALAHAFNAMADAAQRNERARRAMVNDVAHELRNPLANIRGHLEAAQDHLIPVDDALIDSLLEEAGTLERLTSDLRDLALADAGRLHLHLEEVDLSDVAAQVVAAARARAAASNVTLSVDAGSPVPVLADPTRMRQALGNLVDNSLRYTPAGESIRVVVAGAGDRASVSVSDSGSGIDPSDLPHLFDRFYRADPSRTRRTGGSGLGLAIAKHLVEAHRGTITVSSEPGRGSTFTVELPRNADAPGSSLNRFPGGRPAAAAQIEGGVDAPAGAPGRGL